MPFEETRKQLERPCTPSSRRYTAFSSSRLPISHSFSFSGFNDPSERISARSLGIFMTVLGPVRMMKPSIPDPIIGEVTGFPSANSSRERRICGSSMLCRTNKLKSWYWEREMRGWGGHIDRIKAEIAKSEVLHTLQSKQECS